ncbi:MAG: hypothetical protein NVS3B5_14630 [Sphingomicrobium sp.]
MSRLFACAIERLDELDIDVDLEAEITEQDGESEIDGAPEFDDHGDGKVGHEGKSAQVEDAAGCGLNGIA